MDERNNYIRYSRQHFVSNKNRIIVNKKWLFHIMMDYGNTHPKTDVVSMALIWSAYAGIGAVYHWNKNWNELQATGLFEILTRERGISEMDEYVLDCINMPFGSGKQKKFTQFLYSQNFLSLSLLTPDEEEDPLELLMCAAKAMFVFGMAFEMNRLGMM